MRIESVEYSKIFKAYASQECIDLLDKRYRDKETIASITDIEGDLCIRVAIDYDPTILGYLRMYMSRIQKITVAYLLNFTSSALLVASLILTLPNDNKPSITKLPSRAL